MRILKQIISCIHSPGIKITVLDGRCLRYEPPATVKDVLAEHPKHMIYDLQTLCGLRSSAGRAQPLPYWAALEVGEIYFLVPNPNHILDPTRPCTLCNSMHCQSKGKGDGESGEEKDGHAMRIKLIMADPALAGLLAICRDDGDELQYHNEEEEEEENDDDYGYGNGRNWKPSLETIYEREVAF